MRTNPPPSRLIRLEGEPNFRDLGGYKTSNGRMVKWGLVYRSGSLSKLTDRDLTILERLDIKTIIDFRTAGEVEKLGQNRPLNGTQNVALPINPGNLMGVLMDALQRNDFSSITQDVMVQLYRDFVRGCTDQYSKLIQLTVDPFKLPLVVHCTHGKDRTGMGAAIILSALGVPWNTVANDYMLSNQYRKRENEAQQAQMRNLMTKPGGVPLTDVDMAFIEPLFIVSPTYLDGARREMVDEFGSVENYIREGLGISNDMRDRLRNELLE